MAHPADEQVKIEIFVPAKYVVAMRDALHAAGACRVGNYDHCLAVTQVTGYWRPLAGANPFDGEVGRMSEGRECKLELRCARALAGDVIRAIRSAHPYEDPVINVIALLDV
jgi:hypothetical protein